jgi:hypothetical protein
MNILADLIEKLQYQKRTGHSHLDEQEQKLSEMPLAEILNLKYNQYQNGQTAKIP